MKIISFISELFVSFLYSIVKLIHSLPILGKRILWKSIPESIRSFNFLYPNNFFIPKMKGLVVNERSFMRMSNVYKKEPQTFNFLNELNQNDILWDIGANIGQISIPLAIKNKFKIVCFEPEPSNFFILVNNVYLNNLSSQIFLCNIALHNDDNFISLPFSKSNIGFSDAGRSMLSVENIKSEKDENDAVFLPGMKGETFYHNNPDLLPSAIKLDVDGNEIKVLEGLGEILSNKKLKRIVIETVFKGKDKNYEEILQLLINHNFKRVKEFEDLAKKDIKNLFFHRN